MVTISDDGDERGHPSDRSTDTDPDRFRPTLTLTLTRLSPHFHIYARAHTVALIINPPTINATDTFPSLTDSDFPFFVAVLVVLRSELVIIVWFV